MALAKFLEDNQERLYASLEASRRQVNAIDEDSSKKDWRFIKDRLAKELQLVQEQFDMVLKIVTNPDFENYVRDYEENQSLEGQISYAYSQIKKLLDARKELDNELIEIKEENIKLKDTIHVQAIQIEQSHKQINELSESIENSKTKLANVSNDLNHYKTVFYNRMIDYDALVLELAETKERLAIAEDLTKPDPNFTQILEEKRTLISRLTKGLVQLDEWCGMLEEELDLSGERPIEISIGNTPAFLKRKRVKFTTYKEVAKKLAEKTIELDAKSKLVREKDMEVSRLKKVVERGQIHIASLEKNINNLTKELDKAHENKDATKQSKITKPSKVRHIKKDSKDNIYNKKTNVKSKRRLRNTKPKKIKYGKSPKVEKWIAKDD